MLLKAFWENHDPATLNRQGNDVGTTYRSAVYTTTDAQLATVEESRSRYQQALKEAEAHFRSALSLARSPMERRFLEQRISAASS